MILGGEEYRGMQEPSEPRGTRVVAQCKPQEQEATKRTFFCFIPHRGRTCLHDDITFFSIRGAHKDLEACSIIGNEVNESDT